MTRSVWDALPDRRIREDAYGRFMIAAELISYVLNLEDRVVELEREMARRRLAETGALHD